MEKNQGVKLPFSGKLQVGVVVKDLDKTIEYFSSLGIGPFEPLQRPPMVERRVRGKPADYKLKIALAQLGQIQLELIQPVQGECVQNEFLESKGEGIHHLGIFVDDLEKEVAELDKQGVKVIQSGRRATGDGFAYLDTSAIGGITIELIQWSSK